MRGGECELQELDLRGIDYSAISIALENDKVHLTLLEQLPTGLTAPTLQTALQQSVLEEYADMSETFTEWRRDPDTVVKLDEAGHPVNEAGQAIIDDKGNTAAPTGKVTTMTFGNFEKQLQNVKGFQQALLAPGLTGRQKKQAADDLSKAVTLLQDMGHAYQFTQKEKSAHIITTLTEWNDTPNMEVKLAKVMDGKAVAVLERNGHYYTINGDGTLGEEMTGTTVKAYKFSDATAIKDQLERQKRQYATTKSTDLEDQIAKSNVLLQRLDKAFWLTEKANANIILQAKRMLYLRLIAIGLAVLVVVGILLLQ